MCSVRKNRVEGGSRWMSATVVLHFSDMYYLEYMQYGQSLMGYCNFIESWATLIMVDCVSLYMCSVRNNRVEGGSRWCSATVVLHFSDMYYLEYMRYGQSLMGYCNFIESWATLIMVDCVFSYMCSVRNNRVEGGSRWCSATVVLHFSDMYYLEYIRYGQSLIL